MAHRLFLFICALSVFFVGLSSNTLADNSHARIVRLSLAQGDVRFAPSFRDDPLTDANAGWQAAPLNLPIRQGYVVATDNGRAEIEFENGAMMFLGANTVVEFYDLSLRDGDRITRLVLRQGTSTVYVNPSNGDYFSVTGGDFTVEAAGRTTFRLDNFDDGSTVNIERGRANVLRDKNSTPLDKGQSLSVHAGDATQEVIGRAADTDDFDRWVSGRIDSVVTATNYSSQYVNSPNYSAGFGDLYTYGSWFSMGGYGYCWRPFGMSFGWSPFSYGGWYQDPFFGNTFIGSAPWGWLPYHYGGWIFSPVYGWVWAPTGFGFGGPVYYRPVTAVWVRNGGTLGIVPLHPGDKPGKTAQNLSQGIFPVQNSQIAHSTLAAGTEKWSVLKNGPTEGISSNLAASAPPSRVSRTIVAGASGSRVVTLGRDASISYDPREHRYVNSGNSSPSSTATTNSNEVRTEAKHTSGTQAASGLNNGAVVQGATSTRMPARPGGPGPGSPAVPQAPATSSARAGAPPRAPAVPAPARSGGFSPGAGGSFHSGGSAWGGGSRSGGGSAGSSAGSSGHPSSSGGGGGGHPH
jgi:FecR protein